MRRNSHVVAGALAAVLALGAVEADAAFTDPAKAVLGVSTIVDKACTVATTAMAFPAYTPTLGAVTSTSTIKVACTKGTPYTVKLNRGTTAGGTIAQRLMANGTHTLQYNLYTTAAHARILGDGTAGSVDIVGTGAGLAALVTTTVFGNLPDTAANRLAVPGNYTDIVTVTVAY